MKNSLKNIIFSSLVAILSFFMNFIVFTYSYNKLATPFLNEEQRVDNAYFIMTTTLGLFAASAIAIGLILYFVKNKNA